MKSMRHRKATHKRSNKRNNRKSIRKNNRKQKGGVAPVTVAYADMNTWQSKMSLGQGDDFESYHKAQHGGVAPYPGMVTGSMLPAGMVDPARTSGTMDALRFAQQFRDPPYDTIPTPSKVGGKRKGRKGRKTNKKRRGGALEGAPVTMNPMLLPNQAAYGAAGLNPEYRGAATEYTVAKMRDAM